MIVVCERSKECKNRKCEHTVSHEDIIVGECKRRYCEYAETNVECTDIFTESIIHKISRKIRAAYLRSKLKEA